VPSENASDQDRRTQVEWKRTPEMQLLMLTINFIAFLGAAIMTYGVIAVSTGDRWRVLEKLVDVVAVVTTLVAALLTAVSVYFPDNARPPDLVSKRYSAPAAIVVVFAITVVYLVHREWIHPHIINGLAIVAIAGGLFRTVSR
jgi:hypothetical protein